MNDATEVYTHEDLIRDIEQALYEIMTGQTISATHSLPEDNAEDD